MENKIKVDVYAHDWGFLIPCESGVIWEQQTDGTLCHHVEIEGIFIPLQKPTTSYITYKIELLANLLSAYYKGDDEVILKAWDEIKKVMHFDFDIIWDKSPRNQEGLLWIKLTKFESGHGHGKWVEDLVGKELVLIFPNSD